ncbi:MAG: four helix bundle protein [Opitutaceae bacterium]|nr:four helix bundle protein [Opitutaceae bacterium]
MFNFEKLGVWQKSVVLAELVYSQTKSFPVDERFGLTNQMRRAAVSISSNLAEGCSRHSKADFRRFVEMATGSTFELVAQARIARQQNFLEIAEHDRLYEAALEIVRMLTGLRHSLRD